MCLRSASAFTLSNALQKSIAEKYHAQIMQLFWHMLAMLLSLSLAIVQEELPEATAKPGGIRPTLVPEDVRA